MNSICRAAIHPRKCLLLRPLPLMESHYSTTKPKTKQTYTVTNPRFTSKQPQQPPSKLDLPRPSEVPYQPKVANSVRLIGHVQTPLQIQSSPDGNLWAATILTSSSSAQSLRIPIIFEGDLAHIASLHLKDNDFVFVAGNLRSNLYHLNASEGQTLLQVLVDTLHFVQQQESSQVKKISKIDKPEESAVDGTVGTVKVDTAQSWEDLLTWKDLLSNPHEWWDIRLKEDNLKGAAFERKDNGDLLWINRRTPQLVRQKLDSLTFDQKPISESCETNVSKDGDPVSKDRGSTVGSWRDLIDNPKQWRDYRTKKLNGMVNPKHPDFKHKDGSHALWLDTAPEWVLSKLEGIEFDVQIHKSKQIKESRGEESWKDLVETPKNWWDNRLDKRNQKAPDFKHKETGEGLWLNSAPAWVLPKLPPFKTKQ